MAWDRLKARCFRGAVGLGSLRSQGNRFNPRADEVDAQGVGDFKRRPGCNPFGKVVLVDGKEAVAIGFAQKLEGEGEGAKLGAIKLIFGLVALRGVVGI